MNDQADTVREAYAERRLPVPYEPRGDVLRDRCTAAGPQFAAQMLGAIGQRRGLKGGAPVLAAARAAYLQTHWSGGGDRRTGPGVLSVTRI